TEGGIWQRAPELKADAERNDAVVVAPQDQRWDLDRAVALGEFRQPIGHDLPRAVNDRVLSGGGLERGGVGLALVGIDFAVIEIGDSQRDSRLDFRRHHAETELRDDGYIEQAEENRDVLWVGNGVEQHELGDSALKPGIGPERQQQLHPAAE